MVFDCEWYIRWESKRIIEQVNTTHAMAIPCFNIDTTCFFLSPAPASGLL
jgi:hypothetical protein